MVKYCGDSYFKDTFFSVPVEKKQKHFLINNTGCILFQDADFETFCNVRDVLKNGYTDDIWELFTDLFITRFECDEGMIESEIVKREPNNDTKQ